MPVYEFLLVEDNAGDVRLLKEMFNMANMSCNLRVVSDGEEATAFLEQTGVYSNMPRPELILMDLNLPRKGGAEVLAEIKHNDGFRSIPVLVISSLSKTSIVDLIGDLAEGIVSKPAQVSDFDLVIEAIHALGFK
jgi:CheY-like chemotaxis protein